MNERWERIRHRMHEIIFEADTPAGRAFDLTLLVLILLSVLIVILESVPALASQFGAFFEKVEWIFTILFTIEFVLRLISVRRPLGYLFSFFGLVDLLSILPGYVGLFMVGGNELMAVRILRLIRIFRILKLGEYTAAARLLAYSLRESRAKIAVFFVTILSLVVVLGAMMYVVEGRTNGFESIPLSIYWAVITITTVGYGDIVPATAAGKFIATLIMMLGYVIIAVPTGIVAVSISAASSRLAVSTQSCPNCSRQGHDPDAVHCKYCGAKL
ncbi:ion transporter [Rudanella lutea]|jgi:voltage-gated potassium channel|uniref:ion transporter n=1 Tax=Rudanella lutea TaxID=451374 RepID=UPI00035F50B3|nr:ion transporter [Rudanella lutea]